MSIFEVMYMKQCIVVHTSYGFLAVNEHCRETFWILLRTADYNEVTSVSCDFFLTYFGREKGHGSPGSATADN